MTDPELRQRMKHCKLTCLVGEQAFGDLDFSIFKRRYASLHHHSTLQMMKRNKPISMWFSSKDEEEQKCLLNLCAEKAPLLRQQHLLEEKDCVARSWTKAIPAVYSKPSWTGKKTSATAKSHLPQRKHRNVTKANPHLSLQVPFHLLSRSTAFQCSRSL